MKNLILAGILSLFCVIPITGAQAHDSHGKPNYAYKEKHHHNAHKKHYKHGHKKQHKKHVQRDYKHAKKHVNQAYKHNHSHKAQKKHHKEYVYINGRYYETRYVYKKPSHHNHGHTYYYVKPHHGHHNYSIERNFIEILFGL